MTDLNRPVSLFGAGVLTSLTPCVYPMIPITAGLITGSAGAGASRRRTLALTLTYVLGLALLYATLGLLAGLSGSLFGSVAANPWARFAIGESVSTVMSGATVIMHDGWSMGPRPVSTSTMH